MHNMKRKKISKKQLESGLFEAINYDFSFYNRRPLDDSFRKTKLNNHSEEQSGISYSKRLNDLQSSSES